MYVQMYVGRYRIEKCNFANRFKPIKNLEYELLANQIYGNIITSFYKKSQKIRTNCVFVKLRIFTIYENVPKRNNNNILKLTVRTYVTHMKQNLMRLLKLNRQNKYKQNKGNIYVRRLFLI